MGRHRQVLAVAALFLVLGLASLWPIPADPAETALDLTPKTDYRLSMYLIHWGAHALMTDPLGLHHTNMFYPERYTYAYSTMELSQSLLALPVVAAFENPVLTYNFCLLVSMVLGGVGLFLLARRTTGSAGAALFGAAIYVFNPAHFGRYGQIQLFSDHWLPWFLLAVASWTARRDGATEDPDSAPSGAARWGPPVAVAVAYCLHALSGAHNAVFGTLLGVLAVGWASLRRRLWADRRFWAELAVATTIAVLVLGPVFYPYLIVEERMVEARVEDVWTQARLAAGPHELLAAGSRLYRWLDRRFGWPSGLFEGSPTTFLFPGLVPLLLAGLGALGAWKGVGGGGGEGSERESGVEPTLGLRFWLLAFGVCLLLALGPRFGLYLVLAELPGIRLIRVPSRFLLPGVFALAMVAAFGARRVIRRFRSGRGIGTAVLLSLSLLFAVEAAFAPLPTRRRPAEPLPWVRWLGEQSGEFTVLEVPVTPDSFAIAMRQTLQSVHHWKNLIVGYSGYRSEENERLQRYLRRNFPSERCLDLLERLEVRYVIALEERMGPRLRSAIRRQPRLTPVQRFDAVVIYRLEPGGTRY